MQSLVNQYRPSSAVVSKALLIMSMQGNVQHIRKDFYRVRSSTGGCWYLCSPRGCNCRQGLNRSKPFMCSHRLVAAFKETE